MYTDAARYTDHFFPRPEDDPAERPFLTPFGRKEIRLARLGGLLAACPALGLAILPGAPFLLGLLAPAAVGIAVVPVLFRNPRRRIPDTPGVLLAPADGTIADIERVHEPDFLGTEALRIGIRGSLFDAYLNRSPCGGRVRLVDYRRGETSHGNPGGHMLVGIERVDTGGPEGERILVRQISGRSPGRVACRPRRGDRVWRGGLLGMNTFGSRTELYVPLRGDVPFDLTTRKGTRVRAGTSIVGAWRDGDGRKPSDNR